MDNFKVKWEDLDGLHVSDWGTKTTIKSLFNRKKKERILKTIWAELIYSPTDNEVEAGTFDDSEYVLDSFDRRVIDIFGSKMICP